MKVSGQDKRETIHQPEGIDRDTLDGRTCTVMDRLRATSTIITALAVGCRRIVPVPTVERALFLKKLLIQGLSPVRGGVGSKGDGFYIGNSPEECTYKSVQERGIILVTTNGTCFGTG